VVDEVRRRLIHSSTTHFRKEPDRVDCIYPSPFLLFEQGFGRGSAVRVAVKKSNIASLSRAEYTFPPLLDEGQLVLVRALKRMQQDEAKRAYLKPDPPFSLDFIKRSQVSLRVASRERSGSG
jgi:hypothetical protein